MKVFFTALLFATFFGTASAQVPSSAYTVLPKDSATQEIAYAAVVRVPNTTKDELFLRAQQWAAQTFVDSKLAVRVEEKQAGTLVYHGTLSTQGPAITYAFTTTIQVKDGRYRYTVNDISRTWGVLSDGHWVAGPMTKPLEYFGTTKLNKGQQEDLSAFNSKVAALVANLYSAMQKGSGKADW